eukprot:678528-Hanusia_phi.AAC.1
MGVGGRDGEGRGAWILFLLVKFEMGSDWRDSSARLQFTTMFSDLLCLGPGAAEEDFVLFSYSEKKIGVWDVKTGKCVRELSVESDISLLTPGPDGNKIAAWSASADRVWVWEVETGRRRELEGLQGEVEVLSWGPDGKSLVSLTCDVARVWDVETGEALQSVKAEQSSRDYIGRRQQLFTCITLTGDERLLWLQGGKRITTLNHIRSYGSLQSLPQYSHEAKHLSWDPKTNQIAVMSRNQLRVWEVRTGRKHQLQYKKLSYDSWTWGPDGKRIAGTSKSGGRAW